MANPQPENGFVKLANEIWNEIIRRDFSKRQKDIILFIWRLSYGCQKKTAIIPKLKDFELCGIGYQNIRKELDYLVSCRVISWDTEDNLFTVNKDYEQWQISPVRGWDEEKFKELISKNLGKKTKETSQNKKSGASQNEKENTEKTKIQIVVTSQNKKLLLLKTRRSAFLKREARLPSNPCGCKVKRVPKDNIKDSIKDIKSSCTTTGTRIDPFTTFRNHKFGVIDETTEEMIQKAIDDSAESWVIEAMKEAIRHNKISWSYVESILNRWSKIEHHEPWTLENSSVVSFDRKKNTGYSGQQRQNRMEQRNEHALQKIKEAEARDRERSEEIIPGYPKLL